MALVLKFLDTETTGLPKYGPVAMIQYCVAVWEDGIVTSVHDRLILPPADVIPQAKAVEVNGYDRAAWIAAGATPFNDADAELLDGLLGSDAVIAGANVAFDKEIVGIEFSRMGLLAPDWSHRDADISKMAYPLIANGELSSASLKAVAAFFGHTVQGGLHSAPADVEAAIVCFEGLIDRLVLQPAQWRAALEKCAAYGTAGASLIAREALGLA